MLRARRKSENSTPKAGALTEMRRVFPAFLDNTCKHYLEVSQFQTLGCHVYDYIEVTIGASYLLSRGSFVTYHSDVAVGFLMDVVVVGNHFENASASLGVFCG
jgi:hypothetical protein